MAESRDEIETRIESLAQQVAELRLRVHSLEGALETGGLLSSISATEPTPAFPSLNNWAPADVVGLAGRSLVILGGAFLLRAVSAAALLPDVSGPVLGLLYAAWWLVQADRTADVTQPTSALFYGLSSIAIAFPLIWETTARFHLLPGWISAPAVVAFFTASLVVSWRRGLRSLSWVAAAATLVTILALMFATREFVLYTAALLAVAAVVEGFGCRDRGDRWTELRWASAVCLDAALALLALLVSQPRLSSELAAGLNPGGVVAVSLLAPAVWVASVASGTLLHRRAISAFELAQVAVSLLFGIGTALVTLAFHGGDPTGIAISIVVIGVVCYAVAFRSMDVAEHPRRNFYAYTSFAGILVGVGTTILLDGTQLALTWFALACVATALGVHHRRNTLQLHGALYLTAAFLCSGLALLALRGLFGPLDPLHPSLTPVEAVVVLGCIGCYALLAASRSASEPHWSAHVPRFIVAAAAVWSVAGMAAPALTGLLMTTHGGLDANATLASVRTGVLATLSAASVWAGRRFRLDDLVWLVVPLMVFGGARLLWEDLSYGGPVHLFFALGFYGGALILTSRLLKQKS